MPKTVPQFTGMLVTAIIVFGTDLDVYYAMPLGILAGSVAIFFMSVADQFEATKVRVPVRRSR